MQDGATYHTTENNMTFFKEKINSTIISNKTDVVWPPNSLDLNPLDYFFWGYIMQEIFKCKPSIIDALKTIVEEFILRIDMIRK